MENIEGLVEQPLEANDNQVKADEGSMYGKFKDATSMLKAYKNLEAEFTRKSQRVASLERELEEKNATSREEMASMDVETNEDKRLSENVAMTKEEFKQSVEEFFSANPEAKEYKSRMSRILHENPEYMISPKRLEIAYALAKSEGLKQPADIIKDQKFIEEYVLSDSRIKDLIITEYIQNLARGGLPKTINGAVNVQMVSPKPDAPRTIREASALAKKYFG